jgi:hypothetical protein
MDLRQVVVLGMVTITSMSPIACGDDDDETTTGANGASGEAVAPPPDRAFRGLSTALEPEGLDVAQLAGASLNGAEAGVETVAIGRGRRAPLRRRPRRRSTPTKSSSTVTRR